MKYNYLLIFISIPTFLSASISTEWRYANAVRAAQDEQWDTAQQRMHALMIDDPDRPDLQYDSGVVAYKKGEYTQANAYFQQAAQNERASAPLKKQAHFNAGNTLVALNQLEDAVHAYEAALAIDPDDEHVQHNLKEVRKRIQEQKKQEQKQEQGDQSNEDQKEDTKDRNQQKSSDDGSQKQQDEKNKEGDEQNSHQHQGDQHKDGEQNRDQEKDQSGQEGEQQDADQQQEGDQKERADNQSDGERRTQEQEQRGDTHNASPQQDRSENEQKKTGDADLHHTQADDKSQEMQSGELDEQEDEDLRAKQLREIEQQLAPHERWMARLLQQRERADEEANKRIVKTMIDKELAGEHGQNCW